MFTITAKKYKSCQLYTTTNYKYIYNTEYIKKQTYTQLITIMNLEMHKSYIQTAPEMVLCLTKDKNQMHLIDIKTLAIPKPYKGTDVTVYPSNTHPIFTHHSYHYHFIPVVYTPIYE